MNGNKYIFGKVLLLAILGAVLAACQPAAEQGAGNTGSAAGGEGFPLVIEHKYGSTTISAKPQRVVSVGFSEQDSLLALGVIPVGIRDWYGDQPYAVWPWAQTALGDAKPAVLPATELNIEQIAALRPDLIVGISSGMTPEEYRLLSNIAPTVAQPAEYVDFGTPWEVETRILGMATGNSAKADELVETIATRITQIKETHPQFQGKSAAVAFVYLNQPGAYASQDPRARLLASLGFETPAAYDEIADGAFWVSFSAERLDLLNTDVVVWIASDAQGLADIRNLPLRRSFPPAAQGREIFLGEIPAGAFSFSSPLSLHYLLDLLVPALEAAVDGDPATLVPEALR